MWRYIIINITVSNIDKNKFYYLTFRVIRKWFFSLPQFWGTKSEHGERPHFMNCIVPKTVQYKAIRGIVFWIGKQIHHRNAVVECWKLKEWNNLLITFCQHIAIVCWNPENRREKQNITNEKYQIEYLISFVCAEHFNVRSQTIQPESRIETEWLTNLFLHTYENGLMRQSQRK